MTIIHADFGRPKRKVASKEAAGTPSFLYQFHVSLAFSDPLIWRRLEVSGSLNLRQFHEILQICMGWSGRHSHQFYIGKIFYEMGSTTGEEKKYDEEKFELQSLEESMRWCFTYLYDAGDGWEHEIVLEQTRQAQSGAKSPVILEGEWAPPPEDIGGVHLFNALIQARKDPSAPAPVIDRLASSLDGYDPAGLDIPKLNQRLQHLYHHAG